MRVFLVKFENLFGGMCDVIWMEVFCLLYGVMELWRYVVVDVMVVEV